MYKNSKNCSVDLNLQANNYIASCICVCVHTHTQTPLYRPQQIWTTV